MFTEPRLNASAFEDWNEGVKQFVTAAGTLTVGYGIQKLMERGDLETNPYIYYPFGIIGGLYGSSFIKFHKKGNQPKSN